MGERVDDRLLALYLSAECSAAESAAVERWAAERPEHRATLEQLRGVWEHGRIRDVPEFDAEHALWRRILTGMVQPTGPRLVRGERSLLAQNNALQEPPPSAAGGARRRAPRFDERLSGRYFGIRGWLMAASLMVAAVGTAYWRGAFSEARDTATAAAPVAMRELTTTRGGRAEVHLADGTHVVLGAESRLRFAAVFGARRDVYLDGEAFFDVVHDEARPFAVHATGGVARDVGTKFTVRAYPETRGMEVVVVEGAVALRRTTRSDIDTLRDLTTQTPPEADSVLLMASDFGRVSEAGTVTLRRRVDVTARLAWMEGGLVFKNTPLRDALTMISRRYNVSVRLAPDDRHDVSSYSLTATLSGESLDEVLTLLAAALDVRTEKRGRGPQTIVTLRHAHASP